jgi:hypothetical protein
MMRIRNGISRTAVVVLVVMAVALTAIAAIMMWRAGPATRRAEASGPVTAGAVLTAIRDLEAVHDPKCHSTACRFENFIYGTPLSDEARDQKIALQKELVRHIWAEASRVAAAARTTAVAPDHIQPVIERIVRTTEAPDGATRVHLDGGEPLEISPVRERQMATLAFSLRAILGVQQDSLVDAPGTLMPLDEPSIDRLRLAVDTVTLSALQLADDEARRGNHPQITGEIMASAWRHIVPDPGDDAQVTSVAVKPGSGPVAQAMDEHRRTLLAMIDNKLLSYLEYNQVTPERAELRFERNAKEYYALYMMPIREVWADRFTEAYDKEMHGFVRRLLARARESALDSGHRVIRAADANEAVQLMIPHEIDDFEDVRFFVNLDEEDRITLESYDCDSYRDVGLHWQFFKEVYAGDDPPTIVPDPFAAEIITEAISSYGVLVLRVAGHAAQRAADAPTLRPSHLELASRRIAALAERHHAAGSRPLHGQPIVSAPASEVRDSPATFFTDVTADAGIDFRHRSSKWLNEFRRSTIRSYPTFSGGGLASDDVDNDGHLDLLFVGGDGNGLFLGDGAGRFRDATKTAGINFILPDGTHGEARQPILADFDNDGRQDILITYNNVEHRLYRNTGGAAFEDVTEGAGLGGRGLIGGPVTTFDFDGDGRLDLYITYFGDYLDGEAPAIDRNNRNALPNKLFRNLGAMRFEDVSKGSGTGDTGWCQAVSHTDIDRDGRQDIIVANDYGRNALFRNLGKGRFENVGPRLGHTKAYHSMNVGITDLNRDNYPDIYISNIATMVKDDKYTFPDINTPLQFNLGSMANMLVKEANVLYMSRSEGGRLARYEPSADIERGETSTGWAWDAKFLDFDHDGDDDLYVVNGTNDYNIFSNMIRLASRETGETAHYQASHTRESNVFYVNENGKLKNRSSRSGADFIGNSRSTAHLDWDGDGDLDIAVANFHGPAVMLRNNSEARGNNWVKVHLVGDPKKGTNRDAIGARIVATNDAGLYLLREVQGGSGYMSQNPKQKHFGLGRATSVDLEIIWPNGDRQVLSNVAANRAHTFRQRP